MNSVLVLSDIIQFLEEDARVDVEDAVAGRTAVFAHLGDVEVGFARDLQRHKMKLVLAQHLPPKVDPPADRSLDEPPSSPSLRPPFCQLQTTARNHDCRE